MVDEDRVLRLLDRMRSDIGLLAQQADRNITPADRIGVAGVKYLFVTAIEGCATVAHHIAAAEMWPAAETNGDAVRALGRRGVLAADLAERLASAVGFRNLLVDQYADVDDARTLQHLDDLDDLDDLRDFVAQVTRWLLG